MNLQSRPTEGLVERASRGDGLAVEALLERYLPGLEAFVRLRQGRMLRAKESSADLVQSVCREVLQHLDRYQYRGEAQFKHWLYTTALRKIADRRDYYRAERRDAEKEASPSAASERLAFYGTLCTPSQEVAARETMARIEAAFDALSEPDRSVILMARMVGLSHAEIAEELGKNEGAVRTMLSRALARLATALEKSKR